MAASSRIWGACRALAVRSRPLPIRAKSPFSPRQVQRLFADDASNQTGREKPSPETAPQGNQSSVESPVPANADAPAQDAAAAQKSFANTLDDATLEQIFYGGRTVTSEGESGLTPAQEEVLYREGTIMPPEEAEALVESTENEVVPASNELVNPGFKFAPPKQPPAEGFHVKKRYHPVLEQITRILMKDGKLSVAQRNIAMVMNYLRTAPAPIYSPKFPLLPGSPPASHLPLNPILYITIAIDSVAPLVKVRGIAGAAGGGRALEVPHPLAVRQRRRTAFKWILDSVTKKPSTGSGRKQLPHRIAEEIIAVVEGRSGVWEKRKLVHKAGTAARANIASSKLKNRKKKM
ncbi:37S ribosomal protein S7 [Paramyrothecium foliicola]|nr:37S ribosomal protein S7 [Paramyrothecium foliicola]